MLEKKFIKKWGMKYASCRVTVQTAWTVNPFYRAWLYSNQVYL